MTGISPQHHCDCHQIIPAGHLNLQVTPCPHVGPHQDSRHKHCSQGRAKCTALLGKHQYLPVCRGTGISVTRQVRAGVPATRPRMSAWTLQVAGEPRGKKMALLLFLCFVLHLERGVLLAQRTFLCCRGIHFPFLLSWRDRKQWEEERPTEVALQVDLKRAHFFHRN